MKRNHIIAMAVGAAALIALTAGASAYIATNMDEKKPVAAVTTTQKSERITWNDQRPAPAPVQQVRNCDDGNIVGHVAGGALGGIAGNQIGKGSGNTVATIAGAVGGSYLGGEYIPTHNVTCR